MELSKEKMQKMYYKMRKCAITGNACHCSNWLSPEEFRGAFLFERAKSEVSCSRRGLTNELPLLFRHKRKKSI